MTVEQNNPKWVMYEAQETLKDLQKLAGCAGGGKKNETSSFQSSITPRLGEKDGKKILCCTCPFCKSEVEAVIEEGTITCPKCSAQAPWSENSLGE